METIRSFIALELTADIQQQLAKLQNELKQAEADVKWVEPQGIHLTLKFLGSISMELLEEVKKILTELAKRYQAFEISIADLGAFPKVEHPRVIWVGIEQGKDIAAGLASDLQERLIPLGFLPEKRGFTAHLTLGRVRSARQREQLKSLLQSTAVSKTSMRAEKLILLKSTLTPQGAIYSILHKVNLS